MLLHLLRMLRCCGWRVPMLVTRQLQRIERKAIYKPEKIMCSQVTSFNISPEHSKQDKHQVGRFQHKRPKETQAYNSHRGGKSEIKASNSRAIAADKIPCANLGDKPSSFTRTSNPTTSLLYLNPPSLNVNCSPFLPTLVPHRFYSLPLSLSPSSLTKGTWSMDSSSSYLVKTLIPAKFHTPRLHIWLKEY